MAAKNFIDNQQDEDIKELLVELEKIKTEVNVYKKIVGFVSGGALAIALSIGGYTFGIADEYAQLKQKVNDQSINIQAHGKELQSANKERSQLQNRMAVIDVNTMHIKEKVGDIYDLVKTMIKQQQDKR